MRSVARSCRRAPRPRARGGRRRGRRPPPRRRAIRSPRGSPCSRTSRSETRREGLPHARGNRPGRNALMSLFARARRTTQHHLRHRVDAELNLIPLIDILSVMVAFLLLYSAEVEVVQNAKGVEIPQSIVEVQPKQSVVVMITKEQRFVQGELVAGVAEMRGAGARLSEPLG